MRDGDQQRSQADGLGGRGELNRVPILVHDRHARGRPSRIGYLVVGEDRAAHIEHADQHQDQ
jgi:hypothetical protein